MKTSLQHLAGGAFVLGLTLLRADPAEAHYQFPVVIINDTRSEWWQYVRPTGLDEYGWHFDPVRDWFTEPQVCGRGATKTGHQVQQPAVVVAGDPIGFVVATSTNSPGLETPRPIDRYDDILYHSGPGQLYLSAPPSGTSLEDYEGDGDWFKVDMSGSTDGLSWDSYNKRGLNFTIPKTTPPGKYLARVEHFYLLGRYGETQQYINCAHIEVVGPGGGKPAPVTRFPGAYRLDEPGVWLPNEMTQDEMKNFPGAGPAVWRG